MPNINASLNWCLIKKWAVEAGCGWHIFLWLKWPTRCKVSGKSRYNWSSLYCAVNNNSLTDIYVNGHVGNWTPWQENFCILLVVWRGILWIRHIKLADVWGLQWSKRFEVGPQSCKSECKCIIPWQYNVIQESIVGSKSEFERKSKLGHSSWYYSDLPPLIRVLMFVDPCIIVQFVKKNPTRCNNVSKFYYSIFIWSSTCFGQHTAHHQEPKTGWCVAWNMLSFI